MGAVKRTFRTLGETRTLMSVARGEIPPDLLVTGGQILNVYSGELLPGAIAVAAGRIAYVGERPIEPGPSTTMIDARGRVVAPGYIDPHAHPYAMFTPQEFADLEAVNLRQHHVKHDQIRRLGTGLLQRFRAVNGRDDREAGLRQVELQHLRIPIFPGLE